MARSETMAQAETEAVEQSRSPAPSGLNEMHRRTLPRAAMVVLDMSAALGVWGVMVRLVPHAQVSHGMLASTFQLVLLASLGPLGLWIAGAYRLRLGTSRASTVLSGASFSLLLSWLVLGLANVRAPVELLVSVWCALCCAWLGVRVLVSGLLQPERVLLVGSGKAALRFVETSRRDLSARVTIVGYVDDGPSPASSLDIRHLGDLDSLDSIVRSHRVDRIVIAFTRRSDEEMLDLIRECGRSDVTVDIVPRFFEFVGNHPRNYSLGLLPMVSVVAGSRSRGFRSIKRAVDITGALVLIVVLAPLLVAIALAIVLDDRGPTLFRQIRIGRHGRPFMIIKFRTMVAGVSSELADEAGEIVVRNGDVGEAVMALKTTLAPDVTRVGRALRRSSLDELPQLFNVVRGDMSLIGPRPLRPFEVDSLMGWQRARLDVRPGMSGLWQVAGRSEIEWDERLQLDYDYVRHATLRTEAEIVAQTLPAVVRGKGAL
jgi:exopolysaccharide biosynthesis polyprenyl glycosylphosphotransferase